LNFNFVFHQQQTHDLMLMHSRTISLPHLTTIRFAGSPPYSATWRSG